MSLRDNTSVKERTAVYPNKHVYSNILQKYKRNSKRRNNLTEGDDLCVDKRQKGVRQSRQIVKHTCRPRVVKE